MMIKNPACILLLLLIAFAIQPAPAANWLDQKRQDVLRQRQEAEETRQREERRQLEEKRLKMEELRWKQEREERENARMLEKRERDLRQQEQDRKRAKEQEEYKKERRRAAAAEADIRERQKNRRMALRNFDAVKGKMWVTTKSGLIAFSEAEECEEYVEYRQSKEAYALRYARELLDESAIKINKNGHLKVQDSNYEDLLPQEHELRQLCEDGEDVSDFETPEAAADCLTEQANQKGIVRIKTFRGDEYWVAYRDLTEYAVLDSPKAKKTESKDKSADNDEAKEED